MFKILYSVFKKNISGISWYLLFIIITSLAIYYSIIFSIYLLVIGVPVLVLTILFTRPLAESLTGDFKEERRKEEYLPDGVHHEYFNDSGGGVKKTVNIKNGYRDGAFIRYHDNGNIECKLNYNNGKLDGLQEWYYNNGNIEHKYNVANGVQHGKSYLFNSASELTREANFSNGEFIGESKEYYENKSIRMIEYHVENKFVFFSINGLKRCEIFISSSLVSIDKFRKYYRKNGIWWRWIWNKDIRVKYTPKGVWKNYRDDGSLEYELDFTNYNSEPSNNIKKRNFNLLGDSVSFDNIRIEELKIENFDRNFCRLRLIQKKASYCTGHVQGGSNPGMQYKDVETIPVSNINDILQFSNE